MKKGVLDFSRYTSRKDVEKRYSKTIIPDYYDYEKIYTGEMNLSDFKRPKCLVKIDRTTARERESVYSTIDKNSILE